MADPVPFIPNNPFWDFLAPDFDRYIETTRRFMPPEVTIGGLRVSSEDVARQAYVQPGSSTGLAVRVYLLLQGQDRALADSVNDGVQAQGRQFRQGQTPKVWTTIPDMAALVIPNVYRCTVEGLHGGRQIVNVYGLRGSGPGLSASAVAAIRTAWKVATGPLSQLMNTYTLTAFRAVDLSSLNGGIAVVGDTTAGGITGGSTATNAAAALVKWNGGTRSRSSRGRSYYGPMLEGSINPDGRTLAAATVTAIDTAFTAFRSSITTSGFSLCVISQKTSVAFDVTSQQVQNVIATQRRRIRS